MLWSLTLPNWHGVCCPTPGNSYPLKRPHTLGWPFLPSPFPKINLSSKSWLTIPISCSKLVLLFYFYYYFPYSVTFPIVHNFMCSPLMIRLNSIIFLRKQLIFFPHLLTKQICAILRHFSIANHCTSVLSCGYMKREH